MGRFRHTQRSWWTRLFAATFLVFGLVACDDSDMGEERFDEINPGSDGYEGYEQEHSASQTGQIEDPNQTVEREDQAQQEDQRVQTNQQQQAEESGEEAGSEVGDINPDDVSDQELATFSTIFTAIEMDKIVRGDEGAVGGGPEDEPAAQDLTAAETTAIREGGMEVDRYLAIQFALQQDEQLRQRLIEAGQQQEQ